MPLKTLKSATAREIISGGRLVTGWKWLPALRTFEDKCSTLFEHAGEDSKVSNGERNYFWRATGDGMEMAPGAQNI
jgi:hypothetical protein